MQIKSQKKKSSLLTIIVGCGKLGASVANKISDNGDDVVVLDRDKEAFRRLSPFYGGMSVVGDALDLDKLKELQIQKAATLLVVTNDDNTNNMVAQLAVHLFSIRHVIARVFDKDKESIFNSNGIQTFCPVSLSQERIDQLLSESDLVPVETHDVADVKEQ